MPDHAVGHLEQIDTAAQPEIRGAASRAYENYFDVQILWVTGAGVMLAVGIFLLVNLLLERSQIGIIRLILSGLGVLVMIFGYGVTLAAGLHASCTWVMP